jgi:hydrogenase expression/formation protein HypE
MDEARPAASPEGPDAARIVIAHGGGGEMTRRLLAERVLPRLGNELLDPLTDSAVLPEVAGRICFTTDAYVVQPVEFPGGDIGRLAVCGTVNDLAMVGARPVALSLALVMEEGLLLEVLDRVMDSIAAAAREAGVPIAAGDTKVVERSRGDGLTITTAGVGVQRPGISLDAKRIEPGDVVLISGRIAEHGLAVMSAREGLGIATDLLSNVAPLGGLVEAIFDGGVDVRFLRDPTRGGLAGVLADLAEDTGLTVEVDEEAIPVSATARHAAELLGLDLLTVANEGKCVVVVPEGDAGRALEAVRAHKYGAHAAVVGKLLPSEPPLVELVTRAGGRRIVQRPYGEDLPRIC